MTNTTDPIVLAVIDKLDSRSAAGLAKYGVGLDRTDLNLREWLQHLQEELLDAANYVEACMRAIDDADSRAYQSGQISMREWCRALAQEEAERPCTDIRSRTAVRRVEIAIAKTPLRERP